MPIKPTNWTLKHTCGVCFCIPELFQANPFLRLSWNNDKHKSITCVAQATAVCACLSVSCCMDVWHVYRSRASLVVGGLRTLTRRGVVGGGSLLGKTQPSRESQQPELVCDVDGKKLVVPFVRMRLSLCVCVCLYVPAHYYYYYYHYRHEWLVRLSDGDCGANSLRRTHGTEKGIWAVPGKSGVLREDKRARFSRVFVSPGVRGVMWPVFFVIARVIEVIISIIIIWAEVSRAPGLNGEGWSSQLESSPRGVVQNSPNS